jgi:hypothetical protein
MSSGEHLADAAYPEGVRGGEFAGVDEETALGEGVIEAPKVEVWVPGSVHSDDDRALVGLREQRAQAQAA